MSSRLEDLRGLAQLLDEGKITQKEFEVVKTEILEASPDEWATPGRSIAASPNGETKADSNGSAPAAATEVDGAAAETEPPAGPEWLAFIEQIPIVYWAAMGATVVTVLYGGSFAPIAWMTAAFGAYALIENRVVNGRWMAWTGIAAGVLFSLVAIFFSGGNETVSAGPPALPSGPEVLAEIPVGSLGVRFADIQEGWNELDEPPFILRGISTTPEAGPLDSFIYRFDGGALLAGAYNPSDDYIYALMGKAGLRHEASSSMYLHLCYLLYPGTQECFDAYVEESGVFGMTVDDLSGADHYASWMFDGNEWRLEIADDIQTLRVLGPQESG
ncbi:MAG: SHOCT domain-containing protein [Actinomycetota bacterium]|nr:SHOCT domain-containing protein [Actinomycetota bacterium]